MHPTIFFILLNTKFIILHLFSLYYNNILIYPDEVNDPEASNEIRRPDRVKLYAVEEAAPVNVSLIALEDCDKFSPLSNTLLDR